jgi:hypothetical protein
MTKEKPYVIRCTVPRADGKPCESKLKIPSKALEADCLQKNRWTLINGGYLCHKKHHVGDN